MNTTFFSAGALGQSALIRNLIVLVLITAGTIAGVFFYAGYQAVEDLSSKAISSTTHRTQTELQRLFEPVEHNLRSTADQTTVLPLDLANTEALNRWFIPILRHNSQITSMLLADRNGNEFLLLRQGNQWLNRVTNRRVNGPVSDWLRRDSNGQLLEAWTKNKDYDPAKRPWFVGATEDDFNQIAWTQPYTFFTTQEPGMTASTRFRHSDGTEYVMAFDVLLKDLSERTTQIAASENGYAAVVTEDNRVLGLPYSKDGVFTSVDARKKNVLKPASDFSEFSMQAAIQVWRRRERDPKPFRFNYQGDVWWGGVAPFKLGDTKLNTVVMVPQSDFLRSLNDQRGLLLGITVLALLAAVAVGLRSVRNFRKQMRDAVHGAMQLGQYTIESKIGSGGMGDVYRARHAMLRRPTAIKLLKASAFDRDSIARFEQEVQLTCRLTHPNTIAIYDYGHTPDGLFYYAMEYLEGLTLLEFINQAGPCPPARTIHILRQICESLREAHDIGLIHRDIKLANVFLTNRGGRFDVVKVLDFGLVKEFEDTTSDADETTIAGSPGYLAPEAIESPNNASPQSDVYALGAVGYALLTAKSAYEGDSAMGILLKQMNTDPVPPSALVDFKIPADLEQLIMRCLERDRLLRPKSVQVVIDLLDDCLDAGQWTDALAKQWWSEHDMKRPGKAQAEISPFDLTVDFGSRLAVDLHERSAIAEAETAQVDSEP